MYHLDTPDGPKTACGISRIDKLVISGLLEEVLRRKIAANPNTGKYEPMQCCSKCLYIACKPHEGMFDLIKADHCK